MSEPIPTPYMDHHLASHRLYDVATRHYQIPAFSDAGFMHSVVAFLLRPSASGMELMLTRRSSRVRQPGDLCCPGGGAEPRVDKAIARLLRLPGSPLTRWFHWRRWRRHAGRQSHSLASLMATALRECFEEIRLQPLGVRFLGMLPPEELVLFKRVIYPVVCWVPRQRHFVPNWEVAAMVPIPISALLNPERYVCYRLRFTEGVGHTGAGVAIKDFTGFRYDDSGDGADILWGVTLRITMDYVRIVHGFVPPEIGSLPVVRRTIGRDYLTGNGDYPSAGA